VNPSNNPRLIDVAQRLAEHASALANDPLKGVMEQTLESFTNGCMAHGQHDATVIALVALDCLAGERPWSDLKQMLKHTLRSTQDSLDDRDEDPS